MAVSESFAIRNEMRVAKVHLLLLNSNVSLFFKAINSQSQTIISGNQKRIQRVSCFNQLLKLSVNSSFNYFDGTECYRNKIDSDKRSFNISFKY